MAAPKPSDLLSSGAGLVSSVAVEPHGKLEEVDPTGLLVIAGIVLLALGAAIDSNTRLV